MKKRKIISAAVVLTGLVLFLIIVNLPDKGGQKTLSADTSNATGDNSGFGFQINQNRNLITNPISADKNSAVTDNLTNLLAQNLSQNILETNNGFSQGTSTIKLPSSDSIGAALAQSATQNLQFPIFSDKDIRIGADNSEAAQLAYIKALGEMSKKNFAGFNTSIITILNNFLEQSNSDALAKYVGIAGRQVNDLLALKVPQQLSAWHLQNLNLWKKKLVVYSAMLDLNSDPLKTIVAFKEIPKLVQETLDLDSVIQQKFTKLTL